MNNRAKILITKYSEIPVQVKASVWFAICSIIQKGLSIITVPLFTRLMTTEQYGYYTTYISWYNIILVFTSLNLFYGAFNNAMMKYREDREGYTSAMQGLVFTITSCFFVIYLIFQNQVNSFLGMSTVLVLMLFIELLFAPALQFWMAINRFEFKYRRIVLITVIKTLVNPILGLIFVLLFEKKDIARIASIVITEVIICLIVVIYQFYKGRRFFSKEYWKYALLFNIPLLPHYLSGQVLNQSDRIMISKMVDNSSVAIYSVAYNIGLLMNIFTTAINGSYTPWFYQSLEKKKYLKIQKVTGIITCLMAFLIIILMFLGPEIITILGSAEYRNGMYIIPPIAASAFFIFLYNIFANVEFYYEKKSYVLFSSIVAALLNILLNFIFIPIFGYIAAAYTTLVCYVIYCLLHNYFARRICKKRNIPRTIFSLRIVSIFSVLIIISALLMNVLYKFMLLRYGVIIITFIIAIIKRKNIITTISSLLRTFKAK